MSTKSITAYVLIGLVLVITLLALLGVWDVIHWEYLRQYFGKAIQSMIIIVIAAVVIYIINSIFGIQTDPLRRNDSQRNDLGS